VLPDCALFLKANRDFLDKFALNGPKQRSAGEEWLFEGPSTYLPQVEVDIIETIKAVIVKPNQAIKLKARRDFRDRGGVQRRAGEEWLMGMTGAYLPSVQEKIIATVDGIILTEKVALHLRATSTFVDVLGKGRKAGSEWLVTVRDQEVHIPNVYEKILGNVNLTTLNSREWCIIHNPVDENGVPQLGQSKLVKGEANFFIQPGEMMDPMGVRAVYVLGEEEALWIKCNQTFDEAESKKKRIAGQTWFIHGPAEFIPSLEVAVLEKRRAWIQIESLRLYWGFWVRTY